MCECSHRIQQRVGGGAAFRIASQMCLVMYKKTGTVASHANFSLKKCGNLVSFGTKPVAHKTVNASCLPMVYRAKLRSCFGPQPMTFKVMHCSCLGRSPWHMSRIS